MTDDGQLNRIVHTRVMSISLPRPSLLLSTECVFDGFQTGTDFPLENIPRSPSGPLSLPDEVVVEEG